MSDDCDFAGDCGECVNCKAEELRDAIRSYGYAAERGGAARNEEAADNCDKAIEALIEAARKERA